MYCRNCGKPITSIATECPYCKAKVNEIAPTENQEQNNQNNSFWNKSLYTDKNGKPIPLWRTVIGLILVVFFAYLAIKTAMDLGIHWED